MTITEAGVVDGAQQVTNVFERIVAIIFQRLAPTFGQRTIAAIAKNSLARKARKHKLLSYLTVSEGGVDWSAFRSHLDGVNEDALAASLEEFLDDFFEALSNLIGQLIVGKLFREAEEAARRGDEE